MASCDTVWAAHKDTDGLRRDAERARTLGFDGKSLVHPGQVEIVNEVFSPSEAERAWARRIIEHVSDASGAVCVDGEMVDAPVVRRARRVLEREAGPGPDPHG